jgi:hypothetical protein
MVINLVIEIRDITIEDRGASEAMYVRGIPEPIPSALTSVQAMLWTRGKAITENPVCRKTPGLYSLPELMDHGGEEDGVLWVKLGCLSVGDVILGYNESTMCANGEVRQRFAFGQLDKCTPKSSDCLNLQDLGEKITIRMRSHKINRPA